jgi:hypothetical protein
MLSCLDVMNSLTNAVDNINTKLIQKMIDNTVQYDYVCVQPNLTFEYYFDCLKTKWECILNNYIKKPDKCTSGMQNILFLYEILKNIDDKKIIDTIINAFDVDYNVNFVVEKNMVDSMKNIANAK